MSVILKEIEKRQTQINEYEAKVEKLSELKAQVACLEKEVAETNTFELKDEIKELTEYAIQLRLIVVPTPEETIEEEDGTAAVEEGEVYPTAPVTAI